MGIFDRLFGKTASNPPARPGLPGASRAAIAGAQASNPPARPGLPGWRSCPALEPLARIATTCRDADSSLNVIPDDNGILRERALGKWREQLKESLLGDELIWPCYVDVIDENRVQLVVARVWNVFALEGTGKQVDMGRYLPLDYRREKPVNWQVEKDISLAQGESLTYGDEFFFVHRIVDIQFQRSTSPFCYYRILTDFKGTPLPDRCVGDGDEYVRAFRRFFEIQITVASRKIQRKRLG